MAIATSAKPAAAAIGGGIAFAPAGTTKPTAANTALDSAFTNVGYVSDGGVTRGIALGSNNVKEWGGTVAAALSTDKTETFQFKVIEAYNVELMSMVFGKANGTLETGITVESNNFAQDEHVWVITMLEVNGNGHRIVIPRGVITGIGNIVYVNTDVVGYDLTITAIADDTGTAVYEYYAAGTGTGTGTGA